MTVTQTRKKAANKKPRGRPSHFTPQLAAKICERLSGGETLTAICRDAKMPGKTTVLRWLGDDKNAEFRGQYAHARELQADALFEQALEIADQSEGDWTTDKDGKRVIDHEHVQRSRLRVDTRKWAAGRLAPKKYGERLQHTGDGGGPIRTEVDLTGIPVDVLRELRQLAARVQGGTGES